MRARSLLLRLSLSLLASALAACGDPGAECSITTGDDGRTSLVCSDGTSYSFPEPASPDDDTCHITARHDDGSVTLTCGEEEFVVGGPEDCRLEARRYELREEPFAEALVARCADGTEQVVRVEVYAPTETPTARDAVAVSSNRSCFLSRHGAATCWGAEGDGEVSDTPGSETFRQLALASHRTCALRPDGSVRCWGMTGELPTAEDRFVRIAAGGYFFCGLREDGSVRCWGEDATPGTLEPPTDEVFVQISSGGRHSCGLREDGTLRCWGVASTTPSAPPKHARFVAVEAGHDYTCGLRTDRTITCWGDDPNGQLDVPEGRFLQISASQHHVCGLRDDRSVLCWGSSGMGRLDVPEGERFVEISSRGLGHNCGVRADGTVRCWGSDTYGQSTPPPSLE